MICTHPISHSLEELVALTEQVLEIEITIKRLKEIPYRGMLLDPYTYDTYETVILVSTDYLGMLKDFVIAKHCLTLLLKGSAFHTGNLKVLSYNEESSTWTSSRRTANAGERSRPRSCSGSSFSCTPTSTRPALRFPGTSSSTAGCTSTVHGCERHRCTT